MHMTKLRSSDQFVNRLIIWHPSEIDFIHRIHLMPFGYRLYLFFVAVQSRTLFLIGSLLVCSDLGIQTRHRFLTGNHSASSFVPMNRLQGLHLVEQLTPVTIRCYVAAELTQPGYRPDHGIDSPKVSSLLHEGRFLLPLMPGCLTTNQLNFINRLCVPFPTLVFILRLVHAVCYGPTDLQNSDLECPTDQSSQL